MKIIPIILFVLAAHNLSAQTIDKPATIQNTFSQPTLMAFKEKSTEKTQEFIEYLNLLGKADIPNELKQEVKENIYKLFIDKNSPVLNFFKQDEITSLPKLLEEIESKKGINFSINNLNSSPITRNHWVNTYSLHITYQENNQQIQLNQQIELSLIQKKFGEHTKQVWQLQLGKIY